MKKRYTKSELKRALDLVEEGYSFSEVSREMRKRKNEKANENMERDNARLKQEKLEIYNKYTG